MRQVIPMGVQVSAQVWATKPPGKDWDDFRRSVTQSGNVILEEDLENERLLIGQTEE